MAFQRADENRSIWRAKPDILQDQSATLKADWDRLLNENAQELNGLIDELEASTAAGQIGSETITGVAGNTVQAALASVKGLIDGRYTKTESDALISQATANLVEEVDVNLTTGVITVTKKDGSTESFDTALEKVPATFELTEHDGGVYLKITNVDGSSTETNVTELMNVYTFQNSDEVAWSVTGDGNVKTVTAALRDNSIGMSRLSLSVVTQLEAWADEASAAAASALASKQAAAGSQSAAAQSAQAAQASQTAAAGSAAAAQTSGTQAAGSAQAASSSAAQASEDAVLSKSYAVGGTGTRAGEDTDNAKWYKEQAQAIVGSDFATRAEAQGYVDTHDAAEDAHVALFEAAVEQAKAASVSKSGDTMTGPLETTGLSVGEDNTAGNGATIGVGNFAAAGKHYVNLGGTVSAGDDTIWLDSVTGITAGSSLYFRLQKTSVVKTVASVDADQMTVTVTPPFAAGEFNTSGESFDDIYQPGTLTALAVGRYNHASGNGSFAGGLYCIASGSQAHAQGYMARAQGTYSHAEGQNTTATGDYAHAEGRDTTADAWGAHAEGNETLASGRYSHAEGSGTKAQGQCSHAEGSGTEAIGVGAHAAGNATTAFGAYTYAGGHGTRAQANYSTIVGKYGETNADTLFAVANGTSSTDKKLAFEVKQDGSVLAGSEQVAKYRYGTEDLTAGESALPTGVLYFVYE
ncbi:hypothetical protein [Feifania hominis]|uniref:Trimeric autotransporter adhesin YadA-like head domain-containing protein n=1 Tax=Feifania hominis TaxID=2763660 RepID=A0A926DFH7_9FIRM|nr:hypothetical protein [Feifania hominis]MBC8537226.1 hypothetical protein [Feifania hominis]